MLVRLAHCPEGHSEIELDCDARPDYGRGTIDWDLDGELGVATAIVDGISRCASSRHGPRARRRRAVWGTRRLGTRRKRLLRADLGRRRSAARRTPARRRSGSTRPAVLAPLARAGQVPRPPLARRPAALGAGLKGLTYAPTGGDGRGARRPRCRRRPAASATGTTATAGSATRPSRSGACTRSASTRRRATSWASSSTSASDGRDLQIMYGIGGEKELTEATLDHLTATAARGRCGSATPPTTSARTTSTARCSTRSTFTRGRCGGVSDELWSDRLPAGRGGDRGLGAARPGDLGGARRAEALRLLEADVLGGGRPRRPARRRPAASASGPRSGRREADGSRTRSSSAGTATASSASTTRPTRSTPRPC